jgi:hypothetical protein
MKRINLSLAFLFSLALLSNSSCTICSCKTVDCPAFNDPVLDQWITAMENDTLVFKNAFSATDTLVVGKIQRSAATQVTKGCMHSATGCDAWLSLFDAQAAGIKFSLTFESFTGWDNQTSTQFAISFKDLTIKGTGVTDTGFVTSAAGIQTLFRSAISLNGKNFANVQLISADSTGRTAGITKLYFARNIGVIAYETYPASELWVRQ